MLFYNDNLKGRVVQEKGPLLFVKTISLLRQKGISNFHAVMVGDGPDMPEVSSEARNLEGWITLTGSKTPNEVKSWMALGDILVSTSGTGAL